MKRFLSLLILVALPALAGERLLGTIVSAAGADTTNATTAVPFAIPPNTKLTITCTAAANICANSSTACTALAGANSGVPVVSGVPFPTSANSGDLTTTAGAAVGPPRTVVVAGKKSVTFRIFGAAAVSCVVWARNGDE
jgi:hypothetical protein